MSRAFKSEIAEIAVLRRPARGFASDSPGTLSDGEGSTSVNERAEHYDVVVIGAGQAGLAMGYLLSRQKRRFLTSSGPDLSDQRGENVGTH